VLPKTGLVVKKGEDRLDNFSSNSLAHLWHVAIMPDGNGRWARQRHEPPTFGHQAGLKTLYRVIQCAIEEQIEVLTIYGLSTENWRKRPQQEIEGVKQILLQMLGTDAQMLDHAGVRVRILGRLHELPGELQRVAGSLMEVTSHNSRLTLNICFNYGGRAELVDAARSIIAAGYDPVVVNEETINAYLYTRDVPEPDLVIRTGGEIRISNFQLWQSAFSEYYFGSVLWPDFTEEDFREALSHYRQRKRSFGGRLQEETSTILSPLS
jgi:undecaprenyl diphosphate synthase